MISEFFIITTLLISNPEDVKLLSTSKKEETPTKEQAINNVNDILKIAKKSIKNDSMEDFEYYFHFPLTITSASDAPSKTGKNVELYTVEDLRKNYKKIINDTNIKLINCLNDKNLIYNRYKGFNAAYGGIWITARYVGNDVKYKISSISTDFKTTEDWIVNNCNN